jgi:RNA polymerase II subunit A-like phosphatase
VDETSFLIEVESDHGPFDSLPFESENGFILTPEEDEDVPVNGILGYERGNIIEPVSPSLGDGDWDEVNAELEAFMDSDSDDDTDADPDREGDGGESDASTRSNVSGRSTSSRSRKRKRAAESADGSGAEDSDDATNGALGSDLQKRKKRALERTTGLANVATADNPSGLPSPDTTGPEEDEANANGDAEDEDDDDFEKAMMAEFARDEDDGIEA